MIVKKVKQVCLDLGWFILLLLVCVGAGVLIASLF